MTIFNFLEINKLMNEVYLIQALKALGEIRKNCFNHFYLYSQKTIKYYNLKRVSAS